MTEYFNLRTGMQRVRRRIDRVAVTSLLMLAVLALLSLPNYASADAGPAAAGREPQADPLVRCEPTSVTALVGQTAVIDLYIQDVANLYGADLRVSYNPTIGQVVDQDTFTPGTQVQVLYTFLSPFFVIQRSAYGPTASPPNCGVDCIWYAATQANPTPPATGSGAVVRVTFLGLQAGTFPMNWINNQLSAPGGVPITPVTNQPCSVTFTNPLAVTLAGFDATEQPDHVLVAWETVSESGNAGFNLYRSETPDGLGQMLNTALIPSQNPGAAPGAAYSWQDFAVQPGRTYYYWLEDVSLAGAATQHGPVSVDFVTPTAVTLSDVQASPAAGAAALPWPAVVAVAAVALALRRRR